MFDSILVEQSQLSGVSVLRLNRPAARNALNIQMMQQVIQAHQRLSQDSTQRVLIVTGEGPVFCAGLDLKEAMQKELVARSAALVAETLDTLKFGNLVTIAAVQGGAFAGGGGLVAACDLAIGSQDCKIGFPEARRGLLPALICEVLKTKVREGDLTELFLVGQAVSAERALQMGILQRIVPADQLMPTAMELAANILAGGPKTIVQTKHLLHHAYHHRKHQHGTNTDQAASHPDSSTSTSQPGNSPQLEEHLKARCSDEAEEGLRAFQEKRPPKWMERI